MFGGSDWFKKDRKKFIFTILFFVISELALSSPDIVFSVIPTGYINEHKSGCRIESYANCFDSLENVFYVLNSPEWQNGLDKKIRQVDVVFPPGVFRLNNPVRISWGRGNTEKIILNLLGAEKLSNKFSTIISGAKIVPNDFVAPTRKFTNYGLSVNVKVIDVSDFAPFDLLKNKGFGFSIHPVRTELFQNDLVYKVASWPNSGYAKISKPSVIPKDDSKLFAIEDRDVSSWFSEEKVQVLAYWFYDWASQIYSVKPSDNKNFLEVEGGALYGIRAGQRLKVVNSLAELDSPGEWFLDSDEKNIYFWPAHDVSLFPLELSVSESAFIFYESSHVFIKNISFQKFRGDAIIVLGGRNIIADTIEVRNVGNRAFVVKNSNRSGIKNSILEDLGEGGIYLSGGDRLNLNSAGNFSCNNIIKNFSRLLSTYRFALEIDGVGQRVVGNVISDAPHTAILFSGNDHLIAGNDISNVVNETGDAGAIYTGRDLTARGTVIENNFIHDIKSDSSAREVKGIYLDDSASGITIRDNVFSNVQQPVFIGGGRDNLIVGNVFYKSSPGIYLDARGLNWAKMAMLDPVGTIQSRLDAVPFDGAIYSERYPNLSTIRHDDFGAPKYNVSKNNYFIESIPYKILNEAAGGIGSDDFFVADDYFLINSLSIGRRFFDDEFCLK